MAKSSKSTPVIINPPSKSMLAWLTAQDKDGSPESASPSLAETDKSLPEGEQAKPVSLPDTLPADAIQPGVAQPDAARSISADVPKAEAPVLPAAVEVNAPGTSTEDDRADAAAHAPDVVAGGSSAPAGRKPKSKAGTYSDVFFKKTPKTDTDTALEGKPVRVSEESHLMLSVIVSEARRQGYKLNIGDLLDNLVNDHRAKYKGEVDELIASWKARKRFDF